jgi:hypothetical protein
MAPALLTIGRPFMWVRPPLSTFMTALIHCSGTSNRWDASAM